MSNTVSMSSTEAPSAILTSQFERDCLLPDPMLLANDWIVPAANEAQPFAGDSAQRLNARVVLIARMVRTWMRCWSIRADLSALTDAELADIGIIRCNIRAVASFLANGGAFDRLGRLGSGGPPDGPSGARLQRGSAIGGHDGA